MSGIADNVANVSKQIVSSLPPGFLMLVLINTIFVFGLLWFLDREELARERLLAPLLTACVREVPIAALEQLKGKLVPAP